ncbi:hypothetical protein PIB30_071581 [Stylosanthes scabra]|uniref:Uncharacterized protein n=1 Tax=Stylosanthes scabra TaxID=79078 RepID=A0ABU6ZMN2_9FABA|nr:hypothetical protein [Stylosanthes scabra]
MPFCYAWRQLRERNGAGKAVPHLADDRNELEDVASHFTSEDVVISQPWSFLGECYDVLQLAGCSGELSPVKISSTIPCEMACYTPIRYWRRRDGEQLFQPHFSLGAGEMVRGIAEGHVIFDGDEMEKKSIFLVETTS